MVEKEGSNHLKRVALALLVAYATALVVGTHVPRQVVQSLSPSDKLLHFSAYAGLSFLVFVNWSLRRPLSLWHCLATLALLSGFGALDEITQIPFGRDCDFFDWTADTLGLVIGFAVFSAAWFCFRRPVAGMR